MINDMIEWLKGRDVFDKTGTVDAETGAVGGNTDMTDTRHQMGAPMHSGAVPLYYSDDSGNLSDFRVFITTTDGYLHAINPETGTTAWSVHAAAPAGSQLEPGQQSGGQFQQLRPRRTVGACTSRATTISRA